METPETLTPAQLKARKADMIRLRRPPYSWTYEMIARKHKVTKQRVQQIIGSMPRYKEETLADLETLKP